MGAKAVVTFDPQRRPEQMAFVTARTPILHTNGDQAWVEVDEGQAQRLAAAGILVQLQPAADWIETPAIVFDPLAAIPQPPPDLTAPPPAGEEAAYLLVQFVAPPAESWISQIQEMGAVFVQSIPSHALLLRLTAAQAEAVRALPFVRWVGPYHPAYALAFALAGRTQPFGPAELVNLQPAPPPAGRDRLALEVQFFADILPSERLAAAAAAGAAGVVETGYSLILEIAPANVRDLLRVAGVAVVEPYRPPALTNFRALAITQVNHVARFRNPGFLTALDGSGEIVGVIDSGLDAGVVASVHPDLAGRVVLLANMNGAAFSAADGQPNPQAGSRNVHGTHVVGTIAGSGARSAGKVRGVAPAASIILQSAADPSLPLPNNGLNFSRFLSATAGFALAHQRGARVHTNSWGADSVNNQYLNLVSGNIDRFCYLNPEDLIIFSAGNSERDINPADGVLDQGTVGIQGLAKNVLTVGASENLTNEGTGQSYSAFILTPAVVLPATGRFGLVAGLNPAKADHPVSDNADDIAMFSDRGRLFVPAPAGGVAPPANQRRVKPDLVAPGTNVLSTGPIIPAPNRVLPFADGDTRRPKAADADFYFVSSGTSMAAPHVAGAALLVRQFYRQVFGQLRRPLLLEAIPQAVDRPTIAEHPDGAVLAWVRHDAASGQNHIVAARCDRSGVRQGALQQLQTNVGAQPAPMLARGGDNSYLLQRNDDKRLRLSCYNAALQPVAGFGTNGVVTVANLARNDGERHPALCVHGDQVAVVWHQEGGDNLFLQRFAAATGAALDAAPVALGAATATSHHPCVLHTGEQYSVLWLRQEGDTHKVQLRFVDNNGAAVGDQPHTLFQQDAPISGPHFDWESSAHQFLVAWVDGRGGAPRSIFVLLVDGSGSPVGAPNAAVTVAEPSVVKNVFVARHPAAGYLLLWEDNVQAGENVFDPAAQTPRFDVNLLFLAANGVVDDRIPGGRSRISDAARDSFGFACLVNWNAITPIWQSSDELNADLTGVYTLQVTQAGRFQAQVDPNTPLIDSGSYTRHELAEYTEPAIGLQHTGVALAWAGADLFLLRAAPDSDPLGAGARLDLMRLNADGLPDAGFGYGGARRVDSDLRYARLALHWGGQRLVAASAQLTSTRLLLFDLTRNADPVATFGNSGVLEIAERPTDAITAQVAHHGVAANFRVLAVWGRRGAPGHTGHTIRFGVLNEQGAFVAAARDLVADVAGTAAHRWFHYVESETPPFAIAAWQRLVGGNMVVFINRFDLSGRAQAVTPPPAPYAARPPLQLTTLPGDSQNAVLAPRPQAPAPTGTGTTAAELLQLRQRQYGVAWQYRPNGTTGWAIYYSRRARDGTRNFPAPVPGPAPASNVPVIVNAAVDATDPQLVWHSDGYGLVWLQQPLTGGPHSLLFTVLDAQGARVDLNFGVAPVRPAPLFVVSAKEADVQDFALAWNGRTFRITWTEKRGDKIHHMQTALAVPRKPGPPGYDRAYEHPSAALVRATLFNGATNLRRTALPNQGSDPNDGYGWGRLNLRQSLAPLPPVTFYARDDAAVATGQSLRYRMRLPAGTRLLRAMLAWTDPPGVQLVNDLHLRITAPDGRVFVGNRWRAAPDAQYSDPLPNPAPANPFESVHNSEQIVVPGAPTLPSGDYLVDVLGGAFRTNAYQTHPGQPFALVFVGSGEEARFSGLPSQPDVPYY